MSHFGFNIFPGFYMRNICRFLLFRTILCVVFTVARCIGASAGEPPIKKCYNWYNTEDSWIALRDINPAVISWFPMKNYTEVSAAWNSRNSGKLDLSSNGTDESFYSGNATGFKKGDRFSLLGYAAYCNGKVQNVKWSDVVDAERLGPYRVADTTGGTNYYETYRIGGAFSRKTGFGAWGMQAEYNAKGNYRKTDPRPLNTVSDFLVKGGLVFKMFNYYMGMGILGSHYTQDIDVDNVANHRTDMFYFLNGLGLFNNRFSSAKDKYSMDYNSWSYGASLLLVPKNNGWMITGRYNTRSTDANADYNKITPGIYEQNDVEALLGYRWLSEKNNHSVSVRFFSHSGDGTEQYYETVIVDDQTKSTDWNFLSKSTKYHDSESLAEIAARSSFFFGDNCLLPAVSAGVTSFNSKYKTTLYEQSVDKWFAKASCYYQRFSKASGFRVGVWSVYDHVRDDSLVVPETVVSKGMVQHDHRFMSATVLRLGMKLEYSWKINDNQSIRIFLNGETLQSDVDNGHQVNVGVSYVL
jgi:hypothetical protein